MKCDRYKEKSQNDEKKTGEKAEFGLTFTV